MRLAPVGHGQQAGSRFDTLPLPGSFPDVAALPLAAADGGNGTRGVSVIARRQDIQFGRAKLLFARPGIQCALSCFFVQKQSVGLVGIEAV